MNIGIVGLGLIGGSLGLELRSLGHRVLGVSRREQTCELAVARKIVDDADVDMSLMATAEVVYICTPIAAIARAVELLIPHLSPTAIITDVGSVKMPVVEAIAPLWPNFVPAHPMAGTEESGLDAAVFNLFAGRSYVFTPVETTPFSALDTVEEIARALQAKVYRCTPQEHDRAVAWISHLPVIAAASLIDACTHEASPAVLDLAKKFASTGFRDTTRVGGGNPELGLMMAKYNRQELINSLCGYRDRLDWFITQIEQQNWDALSATLHHTHQTRPGFLTSQD